MSFGQGKLFNNNNANYVRFSKSLPWVFHQNPSNIGYLHNVILCLKIGCVSRGLEVYFLTFKVRVWRLPMDHNQVKLSCRWMCVIRCKLFSQCYRVVQKFSLNLRIWRLLGEFWTPLNWVVFRGCWDRLKLNSNRTSSSLCLNSWYTPENFVLGMKTLALLVHFYFKTSFVDVS